jgi:hypothetical protein
VSELFPITREEKIACIKREIEMRHKVYPRFISNGRMPMEKAAREIEVMQQILEDYEKQK